MNYELSIIIPAWQAEKYLEACLSSILGRMPCQTEVLLVNDASSDNTLKIAEFFAEKYPKELKVINHPQNLGVAASRNSALSVASGNLCMFVDADDQIDSEEFRKLYVRQKQHDTDLTCGNFLKIYPNGTKAKGISAPSGSILILSGQRFPGMIPYLPLLDSSCGKLFRMSLLRKRGFRFNSALRYGEDTLFTHAYALAADSVLFACDCWNYHYYQHEYSIMHTIKMHTRLQQLDILLCEMAKLTPDQAVTDHILLRKACESLWAICKFSRSESEKRELLQFFWQSEAVQKCLYDCISRRGKWKHRLLWHFLRNHKNSLDAFFLRFW